MLLSLRIAAVATALVALVAIPVAFVMARRGRGFFGRSVVEGLLLVPLVLSHGAGAEVRSITGITVFSGMLGVTLFGLFLTPVFYVALRKLANRPLVSHNVVPAPAATHH